MILEVDVAFGQAQQDMLEEWDQLIPYWLIPTFDVPYLHWTT